MNAQPSAVDLRPGSLTQKLVDKYVGLDQEEVILLLSHKHWVVFRNSILLALFCPFVLLFFVYFLNVYPLNLDPTLIHYATLALFIASGASFICGSLGFLWRLYLWHNTFYVMTNKRLAVVNQHLPWEYEVQQLNLRNINTVTLKQEGFQSLIYGYSDVIATTFSSTQFILKDVGDASGVQKAIMKQLDQQKDQQPLPQP